MRNSGHKILLFVLILREKNWKENSNFGASLDSYKHIQIQLSKPIVFSATHSSQFNRDLDHL